MSKNICVYCASSNAVDPIFFKTANELATLMAKKGHNLIYGGGSIGLMGELAKTIHHNGGKVIGVIPQKVKDCGVCYELADELIVTKDMRERKAAMEEKSDAFITLPGGFGTLEEILEMITSKQLGFHNKPLVFLDVNGFYQPLYDLFEHIYKHNFSKPDFRESYFITDSADSALEYIEQYSPINFVSKWY